MASEQIRCPFFVPATCIGTAVFPVSPVVRGCLPACLPAELRYVRYLEQSFKAAEAHTHTAPGFTLRRLTLNS